MLLAITYLGFEMTNPGAIKDGKSLFEVSPQFTGIFKIGHRRAQVGRESVKQPRAKHRMHGALVRKFVSRGRFGDGAINETKFALGIKRHTNGAK